MAHNVGVFVDVSNLFYSAKSAAVEVNYCRLLESAVAGRDLIRASAYTGVDPDNPNQRRFIDFLKANGYKVISKDIHKYEGGRIKANLDIEMAVDIMLLSENLDVVVLVSGDGDFARLIEAIQMKGVRCEVISFGISTSNELIEAADLFTEISTLPGIFRNVATNAAAQGTHAREGGAGHEVRGVYSYNAVSYSASYALPAERVSGEKERARLAGQRTESAQGWNGPNGHQPTEVNASLQAGQRAAQPVDFGYATHDEPFMLPDADACGDPHSIPLAKPASLTAGNATSDHEDE
jgi:uncharacterized LabA/DUF88 family protein